MKMTKRCEVFPNFLNLFLPPTILYTPTVKSIPRHDNDEGDNERCTQRPIIEHVD